MKERVLIVSSGGLDKSGVPSVIMSIVRGLHETFDFDILLGSPEHGYYEKEFLRYGGRIFRYRKRRTGRTGPDRILELLQPVSLYFTVKKLIRDKGPYQVIHCHNEFDMAGALAAADGLVPVRIGHVHKTWKNEGNGPLTRIYRSACRRSLRRHAGVYAACSRLAAENFYGKDVPVQVLYNGYDSRRFAAPRELFQTDGSMKAVQVGYLCENKNQMFTLGVFHRLAMEQPDAHLYFVGADSDGYRRRLEERIRELKLQERITFLPADTDIPALFTKCNLLLLPSRAEGFGIVLVEAQAMGLACYASDTVPEESNAGGVRYLPLSAGEAAWGDTIRKEKRYQRKVPYDCSRFSMEAFTRQIQRIYTDQDRRGQ